MKEILNKKDKQKMFYLWMMNQDCKDKECRDTNTAIPVSRGIILGNKGN